MTIRKNKFSYFAWILFLIAGFYTLFVSSFGIAQFLGKEDGVWSVIVFVATIVVGILLLFLLRSLVKVLENKLEPSGPMSLFAEGIGLFFLIVVAFVTRFLYITYFDDSAITDLSMLSLAQNKDSAELLEISIGTFLYAKILSVALMLFGIKAEAGMYLNLFLQVLIVFLIYFSFRFYFNKFTAFLASGVYSFLPPFLSELTVISPEILLTLSHAVGFFAFYAVISSFYQKKKTGSGLLMAYLFAGICIGLTLSLDISGLALLFMSFVYLFMAKKKYDSENKTGLGIVLVLLSAIVVWCLLLFAKSSVLSISFLDLLKEEYVAPFTALNFNLKMATPGYGSFYSLVFTIPVVFLVIRFFQMDRDYYSSNYIFIFVLSLISLFQVTSYEYSSLSNYVWLFITVYGLLALASQNVIEAVAPENNVSSKETNNASLQKTTQPSAQTPKTKAAPVPVGKGFAQKEGVKESDKSTKTNASNHTNSENRATTNADTKQLESQLEFLQKKTADTQKEAENKALSETEKEPAATVAQGNRAPMGNAQVNVRQSMVDNRWGHVAQPMQQNNEIQAAQPMPENQQANNGQSTQEKQLVSNYQNTQEKQAEVNAGSTPANTVLKQETKEMTEAGNANQQTLQNQETNLPQTKENDAAAPSQVPVKPVMKYGRRMDYKTAVVSSPRGIPSTNSSAPKAPVTIQNQSNEVTVSVANEEKAKTIPAQTAPALTPVSDNTNHTPVNVTEKTMITGESQANAGTTKQDVSASRKENDKKENAAVTPTAKPPVREIHNPLPTPKKHVAKDMDFDYQPPSADMHFDLVDLRGRDYFDIN